LGEFTLENMCEMTNCNFCGAENMAKGKPWEINEIRQLKQLVEEGKDVEEISQIMVDA
jgi:hypothetical protein